MKSGFTTLAKLLAICFTLALLGGYVAWRVSEQKKDKERLEALNAAQEKAMATIRENIAKDQAEAEQLLKQFQEAKEAERELLMSGSKSELVIPSSKSGRIFKLEEVTQPEQEDEGSSQNRVLLPGSKAPDSILIPRDQRDGK